MTINSAPIPESFLSLSPIELNKRIIEVKAKLGKRLLILGHHYMSDAVIAYADERGDPSPWRKLPPRQTQNLLSFVVCTSWPRRLTL